MEVDFENYGKIVSPSDFVIAARTHARFLYSNSVLMVVHFELVRLEKMSRTENFGLDDESNIFFILSQKTFKHLSNSNSSSIGCARKGICGV